MGHLFRYQRLGDLWDPLASIGAHWRPLGGGVLHKSHWRVEAMMTPSFCGCSKKKIHWRSLATIGGRWRPQKWSFFFYIDDHWHGWCLDEATLQKMSFVTPAGTQTCGRYCAARDRRSSPSRPLRPKQRCRMQGPIRTRIQIMFFNFIFIFIFISFNLTFFYYFFLFSL